MNARTAFAAGLLGAVIGGAPLLGFLTSARAAASAVTVRVDIFPSEPRVGDVVTVQLRSFATLVDGGRTPALQPQSFPWRVAAISPGGRSQRVRMIRKPADPYLWTGTVRFRSAGSWQVCVLNFSFTGHACVRR